jgi:ABC-type phosphate transport system substrate-binding protein
MRHLCVAALAVTLLFPAVGRAGDVALIVNPKNPVADLTWAEVVAIFKAEQQHWKAGERIYLILQESGTPERALLLKRVYLMSDVELKHFWLAKLFRGEIAAFPRVVASSAAAKRIVAQAPNALAFIDAAAVDSTVKALRIDGLKAGEPGYALAVPSP